MLIPLLAQLEAAGPVVIAAAGGGDDVRARKRRKQLPVVPWRDPLYATAELQRELTEDETDGTAAEIIAEAVTYVSGTLMPPVGGLERLPEPPAPVVEAVLALQSVADWSDVIAAIKEAFRRERDRRTRAEIMAYRAKVEAVRRRIERLREEDDEFEVLMAGGWM